MGDLNWNTVRISSWLTCILTVRMKTRGWKSLGAGKKRQRKHCLQRALSCGLGISMLLHERTTLKNSGIQITIAAERSKSYWEEPRTELMDHLRARGLSDSWASAGRPGKVSTCRFDPHIDYILMNE